ncbi:MAG: hypothetical protein JJV97_06555 [SAR324 cluster bacterium]|nr:hypothetical protein [SAR324 cluster bacterium]
MVISGAKASGKLVSILNVHRQKQQKSIERISTGKKLFSDQPSSMILADTLLGSISATEQAIKNTEQNISLLQVADDAVANITPLLSYLKQVALRAANFAQDEDLGREINQEEIQLTIDAIDRLVKATSFGKRKLLDGSSGAAGIASGPYLEFVSANEKTSATEQTGSKVEVTQRATQSYVIGDEPITADKLEAGFTIHAMANNRTAQYKANETDTVVSFLRNLQTELDSEGLDLTADFSPKGELLLYSNQFGSKHEFQVSADKEEIISSSANKFVSSTPGADTQGSINGEKLIGDGQLLKGIKGSANADGLVLRYNYQNNDLGSTAPAEIDAGSVIIQQNALHFQTFPDERGDFYLSLDNLSVSNLGKTAINDSNFKSLKDIDVSTLKNAHSTIKVVEAAQDQVIGFRGKMGAAQKQGLESGLHYLLSAKGNMQAAETNISDVDYAEELINAIRSQLNTSATIWAMNQSFSQQGKVQNLLLNIDTIDSKS